MGNPPDTLWEMPPVSMRNEVKSGVFCQKIMRNAYLEIISHRLSVWQSLLYTNTMRIWEMKMKNLLQEKAKSWQKEWCLIPRSICSKLFQSFGSVIKSNNAS